MAVQHLEMLFIHPVYRGKGEGKSLLAYAKHECNVSEENYRDFQFYKHCGFVIVGRWELDSLGKHYPILHMELK